MSIAFNCSCGRTLRANPELVGKKTKCPGCGNVLTIPAAGESAPATATAANVVTCSCGKRIGTKPEWAGKTIKCPACQAHVKIPGGHAAPPPPKPIAHAPRIEEDDDTIADHAGDEDDAPAPKRRPAPKEKAKGGGKALLFIILSLVLLAGAGIAGYYFFVMPQPIPDKPRKTIVDPKAPITDDEEKDKKDKTDGDAKDKGDEKDKDKGDAKEKGDGEGKEKDKGDEKAKGDARLNGGPIHVAFAEPSFVAGRMTFRRRGCDDLDLWSAAA